MAAEVTFTCVRVVFFVSGDHGNYMGMYSPAPARPFVTSTSHRSAVRSLGLRTQMMARGPGWRLAAGEVGSWEIKITREARDAVLTWAHILRTLREIGESHGLRPLLIDMREAARLGGPAADAAALVFAEFEGHGRRVAVLIGPDMIHALRLHRLMSYHAVSQGGCFMSEAESSAWIRLPPVPAPAPGYARRGLAPPQV